MLETDSSKKLLNKCNWKYELGRAVCDIKRFIVNEYQWKSELALRNLNSLHRSYQTPFIGPPNHKYYPFNHILKIPEVGSIICNAQIFLIHLILRIPHKEIA